MVAVTSLWLPILVAAVLVFVVSSIIHTVLTYHQNDFEAVPDEDAVRAGLRGIPPGDYVVPHASSKAERGSEAFQAKMTEGPIAFMTVFPAGEFGMGASLVQWFLYCILVGLFAGYVAGTALPTGADYLSVFQIVGAVAFAGYGLALLQNSIWLRRRWSSTLKSTFDALVYALLTAGTFGWLWPN
ncbi:MAG: hypothetical protein ACODAB_06180 [Gemmatimonadota bacterium]